MANRRYIDFPIASSVGDSDIILIWQSGANKQTTKATFLSGLPENLDELNDVAISGLTNGQILRYDSVTGKWENTDQGNLDLNDLNDVSIVSPSNGQVLVYNSSTSKWENSSGGFVPYTGAVTTVNLGAQTIQAGSFVKAGGTAAQFLKANGSVDSNVYGTGSVTSVALTMPTAFSVANSPVTTAGTIAVTGAGNVGQYIRGDGSLADFPESSGGGSSVSYYLNGSVAQGTIGGVAYKEINKVPIIGGGTDFTINANGYIASFITDAGDPNLLEIPGGNWNFETYFSASSGGGSPSFYVELYKVNSGGTATLIASNSTFPELIAFGTNIISYFSTLAVPTTALALTDRLAIRYYVTHSGRTITLHTEDNHLCQIVTTFTTGITALNGLTAQVQNFAVGTSGTDFAISSATATHTFNLPTASATNRGALSSADWTTFNGKENAITAGTTLQYFRGDKTFQTLNTAAVPELTNLYYTEARVNANTNVAANTAARHNAVTLGTANGLSLSTQVLSLGLASAGVTGALSGTDWTTFNSKQNALTNPVTGTGTTNYLPKFTGASTIGNSNLINDASGNLGLGVTPSAWASGTEAALQVGNTSIYKYSTYETGYSVNAYFNAGWKYISNDIASQYKQSSGAHYWYYAPSGTAGNAISFTQAMTLTSGGNLLVGTTTDNGAKLQVSGDIFATSQIQASSANSGNTQMLLVRNFATSATGNFTGSYTAEIRGASNGNLTHAALIHLRENNSARRVLDVTSLAGTVASFLSNGSVGIGTDSPLSKFHVNTGTNQNFRVRPGTDVGATNGVALNSRTDDDGSLQQLTLRASDVIMLTSGNVGIGTASPNVNGLSTALTINGSSTSGLEINANSVNQGYLIASTSAMVLNARTNIPLLFYTNDIERMRITSGGNVLIGTTTTLSPAGVPSSHSVLTLSGSQWITGFQSNASSNPYGLAIQYNNASPNTTSSQFLYLNDNVGVRAQFYSNGGLGNYQANNTNLSDKRTKKEIYPLESYWNKFKALEIVKFKYNDQTHDDFNIGVIAQQVESVAPEFVDVDGWDCNIKLENKGNKTLSQEEPLKSIYTADLYHATIKVLQEAMQKIESMQKEIDTLKN